MRIKPRYRILCLILGCMVLLSAAGLILCRADWRFTLANHFRVYPKAKLTEITPGAVKTFSMEEFIASGGRISDILLLVNRTNPLPEGFTPDLTEYNGARMHPEMVDAYIALREELERRTGQRIYVSSDYRTKEEQEQVIAESEEGIAAPVGCSEHQAGLALDVYVKGYGGMSIIKTQAGRELAKICAEYGFVIRYPAEKEEITQTPYEPWHLRYVGRTHAAFMAEHGLCYEEYLQLLTPGKWYAVGDGMVGRFPPHALQLPHAPGVVFSISRDNTGYYIITVEP